MRRKYATSYAAVRHNSAVRGGVARYFAAFERVESGRPPFAVGAHDSSLPAVNDLLKSF